MFLFQQKHFLSQRSAHLNNKKIKLGFKKFNLKKRRGEGGSKISFTWETIMLFFHYKKRLNKKLT